MSSRPGRVSDIRPRLRARVFDAIFPLLLAIVVGMLFAVAGAAWLGARLGRHGAALRERWAAFSGCPLG